MKLKRLMALSLAICTAGTPVFVFADVPAAGSDAVANPKADLTTPKGAALAFGNSLLSGDVAAMRASSTGSDADYKMMETLQTMISAMKRLTEAAAIKYGKDNPISKSAGEFNIAAELEKSDAKVEGDSATIVNKDKPDEKNPMKLKKVNGEWKVDLTSLPKDNVSDLLKIAPVMTGIANEVTKDINAGKYAKAEDAHQALGQKMVAAMTGGPQQ
jgi:hypothetical protein